MENESAIKDFLGEAEQDGALFDGENTEQTDPFKKAPEEASEEVEGESPEKSEDKPQPFHKDPKVQKYLQKEIGKALKDLKPSEEEQFKKEVAELGEHDDLVNALTTIVGNDTPEKVHALNMFRKSLVSMEEKASQKAISQWEQKATAEKQADKEANEYIDSSFEEIEELYGVDITSNTPQARKSHNEYKSFLRKIAPKNSSGEITAMPDIVGSFEMYQEIAKKSSTPTNTRAKELASRSLSRSTETYNADKPKERVTWDTVNRLFDR